MVKFDIWREIERTVTNESVQKILDWYFRKRIFETRKPINVIDDGTVKLEFQHTFLLVLAWVLRVLSDTGNIARNFVVVIQRNNESANKRISIMLLCNFWEVQFKRGNICRGRYCLRIAKSFAYIIFDSNQNYWPKLLTNWTRHITYFRT